MSGFRAVARIIAISMMAIAGVMVAFNVQDGRKAFWNWMLGIGMKTGIYLFLIVNWLAAPGNPTGQLDLMHRLASGFEALGYTAAGDPDSGWHVNSIFANGITFWESYHTHIGDGSLVTKIVGVIGALVGVLFIFLIGLQMLVAKLEFYTMAMLTLPLLGFAPLPQTKFLFEKAIGAMFNLAIKVMCIGFFNVLIARVLSEFTENVKTASAKTGFVGDISLLLQFLLLVIFLWLLVSKVPALVQGLLSGNPSLGGADLISSAKTVKSAGSKAMHGAGHAWRRFGSRYGCFSWCRTRQRLLGWRIR